jgi:hypothetical protein
MKNYRVKYIGLIVGLLSVILSFLFFGRQQGIYISLLLGGLLISLIFYLMILFSHGTLKFKLIWTVVVILSIFIQWLSEPFLINCSYRIYIEQNKNELAIINNILIRKQGEISILKDIVNDGHNQLTPSEKNLLIEGRKKLKVYIISKSENGIYYGLYGFLNIRLGLTYWTNNKKPDKRCKLLKDNWYH